jgi:hypothetical protein
MIGRENAIVLQRLTEPKEWKFFGILPRADPVRSLWPGGRRCCSEESFRQPSRFAMGVLVAAVQHRSPLAGPLAFVGVIFVLLQVLSPIHQAVSSNLGDRTARASLMAAFSGYGNNIRLDRGDRLVVHRSRDSRVVILEYEVHGNILRTGASYDNRFISVVTIREPEDRRLARLHGLPRCLDGAQQRLLNSFHYPTLEHSSARQPAG